MCIVGNQLEFIVLQRQILPKLMIIFFVSQILFVMISNKKDVSDYAYFNSVNVCFSILLTVINLVFVFLYLLQQFLFYEKEKFTFHVVVVVAAVGLKTIDEGVFTFSCASCSFRVLMSLMGTAWIFSCLCLASAIQRMSQS